MDRVDAALLALRLVVGLTMVAHGLNHAFGGGKLAGTASWFESIGLRRGHLQALMSVLVEVAGGLGLALGFLTFLAGASIIGVMLVAGLTAHRKNGFFAFRDGYEYVLLIAVTVLAVVAAGPGKASVDHAIGLRVSGWPAALSAAGAAVVGVALLLVATYRPQPAPHNRARHEPPGLRPVARQRQSDFPRPKEKAMSMVAQYARFVAKKGMGGAVRDALELAAETAATEVGTVVYIIHVALDDPDTVWMYELYASLEAQQLHSSSEASAQLRATVGDLVGEPIVVLKGEPVRVLGLTTN